MSAAIISEAAVHGALREIEALREPRWASVEWEFQGGAATVLFSVSVSGYTAEELRTRFCDKLEKSLQSYFPRSTQEHTWMVVFTQNGKVVEAAMPELHAF